MLDLGLRNFRGEIAGPDRIQGLALVLTAARVQASGAVERAVELMTEADDAEIIRQANARSRRLREALFGGSLLDGDTPKQAEESSG